MLEPAAIELSVPELEIFQPECSGVSRLRCECCSEWKAADLFDEDCCGICADCLADDVLALPWDIETPLAVTYGQRAR